MFAPAAGGRLPSVPIIIFVEDKTMTYSTEKDRDRKFLKALWDITEIAEQDQNSHLAELAVQIAKAYYRDTNDGR